MFLVRDFTRRYRIAERGEGILGAVIAREDIVATLERKVSSFVAGHTYVRDPVVAATGLAVIRYLQGCVEGDMVKITPPLCITAEQVESSSRSSTKPSQPSSASSRKVDMW